MTTGKSSLVLALAAILANALAVARGDISDYKITVPVICCDMERQGGREKIVSELKRLGASRVLLACDRYQCKPEKRSRVRGWGLSPLDHELYQWYCINKPFFVPLSSHLSF